MHGVSNYGGIILKWIKDWSFESRGFCTWLSWPNDKLF